MELLGYSAKDLANLSNDDIRRCNFKICVCNRQTSQREALPSNVDGLQIEVTSKHLGYCGGPIAHGRDMDKKKVESSNLFLLRLKSICVATRDFDFYKFTIEMHWNFTKL